MQFKTHSLVHNLPLTLCLKLDSGLLNENKKSFEQWSFYIKEDQK